MNIENAAWRKSSHSCGTESGECVEVAVLVDRAGIRDSKDRARGHLAVPADSWAAFLAVVGL